MGIAANTNLVHEAEAQRQHARIKLPAKLAVKLDNGKIIRLAVQDISAGGFSLETSEPTFSLGSLHKGSLKFSINAIEFQIKISFLVKASDEQGRLGCEFQGMGQQEVSALRLMITSFLSGELVTAGDVINTLARQNFTKDRNNKAALPAMSGFARAKALSMSLLVFLVGLGALGFIANKLYSNYFLTHAEAAVIQIESFNVEMPRDGKLHSLIPDDGQVKFGVPIASYETAMLDALKGHLNEDNLSAEKIGALFNQSLTGTISSPCDCVLQKQFIVDGQFLAKGKTAFQLVPVDAEPFVEARFNLKDSQYVIPGRVVDVEIPGSTGTAKGTIQDVAMAEVGQSLIATIKLEDNIPAGLNGRPVAVTINDMITSNTISTATAAHSATEL
ncbi:alginate biosynthesis protein Alg44 [Alkalimarinus alittae]|uniref:Alginate biosynthesis protein Alg44 n=1 Tax=Alkalimarinus alittae TaxID=2961619 RepID=A0ABY6N2G7_9ALTE|nr:alginate biosynthesis protein Alg44 [Alkalimarinus alittae]UZE96311.1 alginate biosynthesis protein Alg44 [Alkalimarinus alittae]